MLKKKAFTLAEVLITLSIIGVVAALTMPALTKNVGGNKIGPQLAKFVNTFETATESMMLEEGSSKADNVAGDTVNLEFYKKLSKYMVMSNVDKDTTIKVVAPDGSEGKTYKGNRIWQLKDGTIMIAYVGSTTGDYIVNSESSYAGAVDGILVDLGGINGKHRAGIEVFKFILDNNGILVPFGGNVNKSLHDIKVTCSRSSSSLDNGYACTGAFADNGWKAPKDY